MLKILGVPAIILGVLIGAAGCDTKSDKHYNLMIAPSAENNVNRELNANYTITEICYQGQVYLINPLGGMSPKVKNVGIDKKLRGFSCK